MDGGWLWQAFAYLAAAVVAVPIAQRFGLGSVLGYLIAGVVIGPFAIGVLGTDRQDVLHFAEFGVVMMLFVIGLELEPVLLWRLRHLILGLGGLQVVVTGVVVAAIAIGIGVPVRAAIAIGFTLSLSSTAIVLQTLNERSLLGTAGGQSARVASPRKNWNDVRGMRCTSPARTTNTSESRGNSAVRPARASKLRDTG